MFSVVGNHDYCEYHDYSTADGAARAFAEVVRRERAMGWRVLLDSSAVITRPAVSDNGEPERRQDSIYVVGVEHCGKPPFGSRGDLQRALYGVPPVFFSTDSAAASSAGFAAPSGSFTDLPDGSAVHSSSPFKILLSHDPSHWRLEVLRNSDIQLTLSGHTHAMQFRIGRVSPPPAGCTASGTGCTGSRRRTLQVPASSTCPRASAVPSLSASGPGRRSSSLPSAVPDKTIFDIIFPLL